MDQLGEIQPAVVQTDSGFCAGPDAGLEICGAVPKRRPLVDDRADVIAAAYELGIRTYRPDGPVLMPQALMPAF
jgi:hypothetical protein